MLSAILLPEDSSIETFQNYFDGCNVIDNTIVCLDSSAVEPKSDIVRENKSDQTRHKSHLTSHLTPTLNLPFCPASAVESKKSWSLL